jgi:hypothetical protein
VIKYCVSKHSRNTLKREISPPGRRRGSREERAIKTTGSCVVILLAIGLAAAAAPDVPRYKPSARSPEPLDIRTNAYGASRLAPAALGIGATAPDFDVPRAGGGTVSLARARTRGPVVIVFYRGHW